MAQSILDPTAPLPLYSQLANLLRHQIYSGEYPVGSVFPTEASLVERYGISRVTVRQAVGVLVDEGLVTRSSGRRSRVTSKVERQVGQRFSGSLSELIRETTRTEVRELELEEVEAPDEIAELLGLQDRKILRVSRTRFLDGEDFAHSIDYLPPPIAKLVDRDVLKSSLMSFLASQGVDMATARQSISSSIANVEIAQRLNLSPGDPVLAVRRIVYDSDHQPLFFVRSYYRGDRYTYTVDLELDITPKGQIPHHLA